MPLTFPDPVRITEAPRAEPPAHWSRAWLETLCLPERLEGPAVLAAAKICRASGLPDIQAARREAVELVEQMAARLEITRGEADVVRQVFDSVADRRQGEVWPAGFTPKGVE